MMLASIVLPRPTSSARMARPLMWRSTRWATSIWWGSALIAFASSVISRSKPGTRAIRSASRRSSCQARSVGGAWSRFANASRECSSTDQTSSAGGVGRGRTVGDSGIDTHRVARGPQYISYQLSAFSGQLSDWALVAPASPVYTRPARSLRHAHQRRPCRSAAARCAGGSRGVRAGVPRYLRASVGGRFPYIEQQGARRRGVAGGFHECVAQRGRVRPLGGGPDDVADQYRPQQGDRRAALRESRARFDAGARRGGDGGGGRRDAAAAGAARAEPGKAQDHGVHARARRFAAPGPRARLLPRHGPHRNRRNAGRAARHGQVLGETGPRQAQGLSRSGWHRMNYLLPERLERLSREYALGTLAGPARRRFERVLRQAPAAVRAVGAWQERLSGLAAAVPPMQPSESVWRRLEERLFAAPRVAPRGPLQWLWGVLSVRALGGVLAGVFLCVALLRFQPGLIGMEPESDVLPQSYVGLLIDAAGKPAVLASSKRHGKLMTVKLLQPMVIPIGSVAQLWALPRDGSAAFPVGVVPGSGTGAVALADTSEKLFFDVSRLAVSIEAAPAKAGDKPSGDFVLSGHCVKLW